jgi:hypothetical protein
MPASSSRLIELSLLMGSGELLQRGRDLLRIADGHPLVEPDSLGRHVRAEFDCQQIAVGFAHGEQPVGRVDRRDRDSLVNDAAHGRDLGLGLRCVDQDERKGKSQDTSYCHDENLHERTSQDMHCFETLSATSGTLHP